MKRQNIKDAFKSNQRGKTGATIRWRAEVSYKRGQKKIECYLPNVERCEFPTELSYSRVSTK